MRVAKGFRWNSDALFSDNLARLSTSSFSRLWTFAPMWRGSLKGEDKNQGAYRTALAGVEEWLARGDKGVRDKGQNWPSFVFETIREVLGSAAGEYDEAL